jgi:hypothetical protein
MHISNFLVFALITNIFFSSFASTAFFYDTNFTLFFNFVHTYFMQDITFYNTQTLIIVKEKKKLGVDVRERI